VTIRALHDYAKRHGGALSYGHSKGAWHSRTQQDVFRRELTARTVMRWRDCVRLIEGGRDVVTCGWAEGRGECPGNFWWASCEYARGLPPCPIEHRGWASNWIKLGGAHGAEAPPARPQDVELLERAYDEPHDGPVCVLPSRAGLPPARHGLAPDWAYLMPLESVGGVPPEGSRCFRLEGIGCAACGAGKHVAPFAPEDSPSPLIFDDLGRVVCARDWCPAEQMCPIVRSIVAAGKKT
jgi:hypothetical protein